MNGIKLVHCCFYIHADTLSVFKSASAIHENYHFDFWTIAQLAYPSECPIIGHMKVNEVKCFTTHIMLIKSIQYSLMKFVAIFRLEK